jgi:S-DNA-T family DNA segregation ATPase FtsK/SpoIIIE
MGRKRGRRRALKLKLKKETILSIVSLGFVVSGALMLISFAGQGELLQSIQNYLQTNFGFAALILPFIFISAGLVLTQLKWFIAKPNVFLGSILVFIGLLGVGKGGMIGTEIFLNLSALILPVGASILLVAIMLSGVMVMTESSIAEWFVKIAGIFSFRRLPTTVGDLQKDKKSFPLLPGKSDLKIKGGQVAEPEQVESQKPATKPEPMPAQSAAAEPNHSLIVNNPGDQQQVYQYPSSDLLDTKMGAPADRGDVKQNAHIIEETLDSFGIQAHVEEANQGPAVTQYALNIKRGTKLSRITALQNDLALALAAPTGQIRIEAPIPGRALVGVEIPNRRPEMVSLRKMVTAPNLKKMPSKTAFGLGLNVSGEVVVTDITRMPHVLIAGSTGSGKSVSVNALIMQILFRASPEEVKFMMVDPKRVELTQYNGIPHLICPVIVEPDKVLNALNWAVTEMNNRYKMFAEVGARNIDSFNQMAAYQSIPYIIIIIDELADIMLFAPAKVEDAITRLAQMARAVGIHLVLATQRPSVDVLTGLIKANVPCRIAFNVTSMIDSRVIIDSPGAEKLIGKGDMLYIPPDQSKPSRIQGAFVSEEEVHRVLEFIKAQAPEVHYTEEITAKSGPGVMGADGQMEDLDPMFEQAIQVVLANQKASASLFQRHLQIGYARAARVLDQLEKAGIVGPGDGAKPRNILIHSYEEWKARQNPPKST